MDIWINISESNAIKVVNALNDFGFKQDDIDPSIFAKPNKIIRMGNPPMRLEIITTISGVNFDDCYNRRLSTEIDGVKVSVISLEDLIINKKASGRHKDLNDLEQLP